MYQNLNILITLFPNVDFNYESDRIHLFTFISPDSSLNPPYLSMDDEWIRCGSKVN